MRNKSSKSMRSPSVPRSAMVLHIITGLNDGGAEAVLFRLCTHDSLNTHCVISLMDDGKYGAPLRAAGVDVHCLNMPQGRVTLRGLWRLWSLLRSLHPQVVQTWMYHADLIGGVVARLAGVRAICWGVRHSNLAPGTVKRSTIWIARICAWLSHFVPARIICCSEQASLVHQQLGYSASKFSVIANGYNLEQFLPDDAAGKALRLTLGVGEDVFLIGMVARFDPQKDHANLISALKLLAANDQGFLCALVGSGMEQSNAALLNLLKLAGVTDRVLLLGRRNDIPAIMNALDIHVLSSLGEAFPNVLAEAMACATPCVTTDVGDAALIVGDSGWVVPPRDSSALASGLAAARSAHSDSAEWECRKKAARQRIVEKFAVEEMVFSYQDVWQEAGCR